MKDFYYILGVNEDSTLEEIRESYRKLSKKFHPDLNQNDKYFESRFREIHEAYEILSNPVKRGKYDAEFKQFRLNTTGKPHKIQSKTKYVDIGFSLILVVITLVFGDYVLKSLNASPSEKNIKASTVMTTSLNVPKHHRKRRFINAKHVATNLKTKADTTKIHTIKPFAKITSTPILQTPLITKVSAVEPAPIVKARLIQQRPDTLKSHYVRDYLYTSLIRSNVTGLVYMRKFDNLSAEVIRKIPTNSQVYVIEKGDSYYKVRFDDDEGYIPKWTVQIK